MKFLKNNIVNFLKGIAIGIANVIPGFSGGTMAVMLKIYDLFVYALANIFNDFKNVFKKSWSLFLGIIVGIGLALVTIVKLLEVIPFITIMFFVGLIIGSVPSIFKKAKVGKINIADILGFVIAIVVIVTLPFINTTNSATMEYNFWLYIILFVLGMICAAAMVIPGVSGSLVLMAFGYYEFVMTNLKTLIKNLFNFSMDGYGNILFSIVSFALGCILGIILIAKLIRKLLEKFPKTVYFTILGLLIASPFSIIYKVLTDPKYEVRFSALTIVFSIVSFIIGVTIVILGEYFTKKYEDNKKIKEIENVPNESEKQVDRNEND